METHLVAILPMLAAMVIWLSSRRRSKVRRSQGAVAGPKAGAGAALAAIVVFVAVVGGSVSVLRAYSSHERDIAPLPDADRPTGACSLWFIGSSTIYKWNTLRTDMVPWDAHGRGVNGARIPEINHWFGNERPGSAPAAIVFYGGENDIDMGADAGTAMASFMRFMEMKTNRYGDLPVIAISLKPSPTRWSQRSTQTTYNDGLRHMAEMREDLVFVDIRPLMLVNDRPGPYYAPDGIHMNETGYRRWTERLHPVIARELMGEDRTCPAGDAQRT